MGPQGVSDSYILTSCHCVAWSCPIVELTGRSMDPCTHPTLTHTVGFLSGHGKGPGPSKDIFPVMAMCKTTLHSDVLAVSMEAWTEDVGDDPVWEAKKDERMLWRGKTTGIYFKDGVPWSESTDKHGSARADDRHLPEGDVGRQGS